MTQPRGLRTRHRALLVLAGAGAVGAICLPPLLLPSAASLVSDSPKEVIDQTWQIVFRDYLDTNGKYTSDRWKDIFKGWHRSLRRHMMKLEVIMCFQRM